MSELTAATLTTFLRRMPQSNQPPRSLPEIMDVKLTAEHQQQLLGVTHLLEAFGILKRHEQGDETRFQARSQAAKYALNSLAEYIDQGLPIVGDWETRGTQALDAANLLATGAHFVLALESRRARLLDEPTPTRYERVAQVLIKRHHPQTGADELLFQYDARAAQYQLIGGRWREADGDIHHTLVREIEEELPASNLRFDHDYQLDPVITDLIIGPVLSPTFGALTSYRFWIYHMHGLRAELKLQADDCWVPVADVRAGVVRQSDGTSIPFQNHDLYQAMDRALPGGLDALPTSFSQP